MRDQIKTKSTVLLDKTLKQSEEKQIFLKYYLRLCENFEYAINVLK